MEANAPKKIFLEWYRIGDKKYRDWCIIPKTNDESVEYTRTDAFIEKACDWLKENITNNPNANSVLVRNGYVTFGMLVDDFKKYMEE